MLRRLVHPVVMGLAFACGGQRVGDEGYFAGEPLPPPEKPKASAAGPVASASSSAPPDAGAASAICEAPPPGGFPKCNADRTNEPCVAPGIGECFLHCAKTTRSVPCQSAPPSP